MNFLGAIRGFLAALNKALSIFQSKQLRDDGRRRERLEQAEQTLKAEEIADEIDGTSTPSDRDRILDRM